MKDRKQIINQKLNLEKPFNTMKNKKSNKKGKNEI
jgi:hypothetical protein